MVTPQVWVVMSKVLLVCEEPSLGYTLTYALANFNIDVILCHDGNKALELLSQESFDLLITEILLPFYSGIEVIDQFLEKKSLDKVLILSAFNNFNFLYHSLNTNDINYLIKPYNPVDILNFIQTNE